MKSRLQHLLGKLAEEAAEVAQIAAKTSDFGLHERRRDQPHTNAERCHHEIDDVMAIVEWLNKEFDFGYVRNDERIKTKIANINIYARHAQSLGLVNWDEQHD